MSARPLVVIPVREGILPVGAFEAVAEARSAAEGGAVGDAGPDVLVIGSGTEDAARLLAEFVDDVDVAEAGEFEVGRWAAALAPRAASAAFVVLAASPDGRDLATRLAAAADLPMLAGALSIAHDRVVVAHHGGMLQSVVRPAGPFVATLVPGVRGVDDHDRCRSAGELRVDRVVLAPDATHAGVSDATVVEIEPADAATMDLAEAPRIVGGGAGMMGRESTPAEVAARFALLTELGEAIGASMGATRVVTDAGYVPHSRQIGTTGVVVDPRLYLAFGISGAVQHTAGLGDPEHVVSVNLDPHCPMMSMADLAVVADANATLAELIEVLAPATAGDEHG